MIEKGVTPPKGLEVNESSSPMLYKWLLLLQAFFPKVATYSVSINPAPVPANSTSEQSFAVNGLTVNDIITVSKPTHTAGLGIVNVRASAVNVLGVTFINVTGLAIDPPAEVYLVSAVRR